MIQTENSVHVHISGSLVSTSSHNSYILGDPGAASWDAIFQGTNAIFRQQFTPGAEEPLPNQFQKCLISVLLISQNIFSGQSVG